MWLLPLNMHSSSVENEELVRIAPTQDFNSGHHENETGRLTPPPPLLLPAHEFLFRSTGLLRRISPTAPFIIKQHRNKGKKHTSIRPSEIRNRSYWKFKSSEMLCRGQYLPTFRTVWVTTSSRSLLLKRLTLRVLRNITIYQSTRRTA